MFRANTIYEGEYLLGTSIARPLIVKRLVEIAEKPVLMQSVMGEQGKVMIRFVLSSALCTKSAVQVIAPWRDWNLTSRETLALLRTAQHPR